MKVWHEYPKVLIIGGTIDFRSGGGITLTNLFKGWPKDRLAIASKKITTEIFRLSNTCYQIGNTENRAYWPINLIQSRSASGEVNAGDAGSVGNLPVQIPKTSAARRILKSFSEKMMHYLGIYYCFSRLNASASLINWIKKVDPDLIYTQLSAHEIMDLVQQISNHSAIPMIIHIMDDWPGTILKGGLSALYWNNKIREEIDDLFHGAKGFMTISETMSDAFAKRYNIKSVPFNNCVDLEVWQKHQKTSYSAEGTFTVLYAGRIGPGTSNSVFAIAGAIEKLGKEGCNIEFQIQSSFLSAKYTRVLKNMRHTKRNPFIGYEDLPVKFSSVDLLVLPMDFDKINLDFIHLSMPTKVPEYMASGTPILVFAHESTALYKYAREERWAFTLAENNELQIAEKIKYIMDHSDEREKVGHKAVEVVQKNHDGKKIRKEMKDYFNNIVNTTL